MKVLFLAAEATPWIKVGGLADVGGELPRALASLGIEVRLALPMHPGLNASGLTFRPGAFVEVASHDGAQQCPVALSEDEGLPLILVDGEPIRSAPGVYSDPHTDAFKYTLFSLATLAACEALDWRPDILHANDWHAAPAVAQLATRLRPSDFWRGTAAVLTVHNLPFMGVGSEAALAAFGLKPSTEPRLPEWARAVPLPLGLANADWLTAVSPTYAKEIQTAEFGCGLQDFLRSRRDRLTGILNGLDTRRWNPAEDAELPVRFSQQSLEARAGNKHALQVEFELPTGAGIPLLAMVTRMDPQKGVDLALDALSALLEESWQLLILGTGDPLLEEQARSFAERHPDRARTVLRFDPALSRRIYGGADVLLVPSRYEPCGLAQMIAMRYGCIPLVRGTGGLKDTVDDSVDGDTGTGFVFSAADPGQMAHALRRALRRYEKPEAWQSLQRRAMGMDFGWERSARQYVQVYRDALASRMG